MWTIRAEQRSRVLLKSHQTQNEYYKYRTVPKKMVKMDNSFHDGMLFSAAGQTFLVLIPNVHKESRVETAIHNPY